MQKEFFKGVCFLSCFLYFIFFIVINAGAQKSFSVKIKNPNYSIKIIPAASNTFGYTISKDNGIMIRQPTIPGMPGLVGFRLKADAQKVAALVISKLSRGMM
ncbi:MAG: DUF4907 domain-containing protein, partial [Ferruginibacter sp.]